MTRRFAWSLVGLALFLTIASTAFAGEPAQTTADPTDPTGGFLAWADALARHGWVGVAMLVTVLGFVAFGLWLRQHGNLEEHRIAVVAAAKAGAAAFRGSRNPRPPDE